MKHNLTHYRYKPFLYYFITFLSTWVFWCLAALQETQKVTFLLIGLCMPFVVALFFVFLSRNTTMIWQFFNKLLNIKLIHLKTVPFIFLLPPASMLIAILFSLLFGFSIEQFNISHAFSFHVGVPTLLILLLAASLEELGWRGYGMESLGRYNYFTASLIFGLLWSLWHFPLFFIQGTYQYEILQSSIWYAINFMLGIIPLAVIVSWVCKRNGGSILAAILFHFIINVSQELFMVTPQTKCIQTAVLCVFACMLVRQFASETTLANPATVAA